MRSGDSAYAIRITSRWGSRGVDQGMLKCRGIKEWPPIHRGEVHRGRMYRGEIHRGKSIGAGSIVGKSIGGTAHRDRRCTGGGSVYNAALCRHKPCYSSLEE
jgi:hypothetical protein